MARKILLVTGASRGIGHATAVAAAAEGWDVCVNYAASPARADATVERCRAAGARAVAVQADVSREADVARLFATCDSELGTVNGLVNCAAVIGPRGRFDALTDMSGVLAMWQLNVAGTFMCCREAVRRMSTRFGGRGGAIVNVSSSAVAWGSSEVAVGYGASKAAIDTFTLGLGREVAADGIRVNALVPGIIDTEMQPPGRIAEIGPTLPMGRAGKAEEIAAGILFLLSDAASYIAGARLAVHGAK
ncbi:MAG: SDR family oxidoreductase [Alphaproteobacteria bacterium]